MNKVRQTTDDYDDNYNDQVERNPHEDQKVKMLRWAFKVITKLILNSFVILN